MIRTVERKSDLPEWLVHLQDDGTYPDLESLLSFILAVGIFNDRKASQPLKEMPGTLTEWEIWPMVQMISHYRNPGIDDMTSMKKYLLPYLNGGMEVVREKMGRSKGKKALLRLSELVPNR